MNEPEAAPQPPANTALYAPPAAGTPADLLPSCPTRDQIDRFEQLIFEHAAANGEATIPTQHVQVSGLYGRSVMIPAGTVCTGAPHKAEHLAVCVGDVSVWVEDTGVLRLTGVHILPAQVGTKRVVFAHADTVWFTVHRNDTGSTDVRVIEDTLVEHADRLATRRQAAITVEEPKKALP